MEGTAINCTGDMVAAWIVDHSDEKHVSNKVMDDS
jgi:hypothetical protein